MQCENCLKIGEIAQRKMKMFPLRFFCVLICFSAFVVCDATEKGGRLLNRVGSVSKNPDEKRK